VWNISTISKPYGAAFHRNKMITTRCEWVKLFISRPPPSKWRIAIVSCQDASNSHIFLHHVENPTSKPAFWPRGGGGRCYEWQLGLAHFHSEYSFLMISPNLHDIWPFFVLIPSPFWKAHLLTLIRLLIGDWNLTSLKEVLKKIC
jgi:hypothetical protein